MNINFTLVIQAIHFFIAYFLLDKFLIGRVLALVRNHEQAIENAKKRVSEAEQEIKNKELIKENLWHSFKNFFIQQSPSPAQLLYKESSIVKTREVPSLDATAKQGMIKELKEFIVKKVSHVD